MVQGHRGEAHPFCCSPDLHRPSQHTALPRLLLPSDYTAGEYPATLEGTVM